MGVGVAGIRVGFGVGVGWVAGACCVGCMVMIGDGVGCAAVIGIEVAVGEGKLAVRVVVLAVPPPAMPRGGGIMAMSLVPLCCAGGRVMSI